MPSRSRSSGGSRSCSSSRSSSDSSSDREDRKQNGHSRSPSRSRSAESPRRRQSDSAESTPRGTDRESEDDSYDENKPKLRSVIVRRAPAMDDSPERARSASPDVRGARDDGGDRGREGRRTEDRDGDREGRRDRGDRGRRDERGADMNGTRGDRGDAKAKPKAGDEPAPPPRRELTEEQKRMIEELEASKPARKPKMSKEEELYATKAGGAYIPPHKLRAMQQQIEDKEGMAYQRMSWDALKKSINGLVNKVNVANIKELIPEFFSENLVRGKGLLARSIITAQQQSPTFTPVYAALLSIINTKLPENGELVLKRLILNFRRGYKRNDKTLCISSARFIAQLVNQQVAHEVLALQIMTLLLEKPTNDSVEVAIGFLKEVGMFLQEVSPQAKSLNAIFERLRGILHEGEIDKRVQYMIEVAMEVRKAKFKDNPMIPEGLDLVEEDDQITHFLSLDDDDITAENQLDVFKFDTNFKEHEARYQQIKRGILGESSDEEGSGSEGESSDEESSEDEEEQAPAASGQGAGALDMTGYDTVAIRRTIYLTIMSSLDYEEVCHKLLKNTLKPGMEDDLITMIIECCYNERSYMKFYGLMAQRFCEIKREYQQTFEEAFAYQYNNIHRLETNKLRNVAKMYSHLLVSDAINWTVLETIHLNEDETNASSRIFIKILFQELSEFMGLKKLNDRLQDPFLAPYVAQLLPKDHPRKTRFAINFFTSIGLGGLTDDLREHLKNAPKLIMQQQRADAESSDSDSSDESSSSDSSSSSSDSDSDSSSGSSSSDDSSSESEDDRRKKRKRSPSPKKSDSKRKR